MHSVQGRSNVTYRAQDEWCEQLQTQHTASVATEQTCSRPDVWTTLKSTEIRAVITVILCWRSAVNVTSLLHSVHTDREFLLCFRCLEWLDIVGHKWGAHVNLQSDYQLCIIVLIQALDPKDSIAKSIVSETNHSLLSHLCNGQCGIASCFLAGCKLIVCELYSWPWLEPWGDLRR